MSRLVAVAPDTRPVMHDAFAAAVRDAGGEVSDLAAAQALIWADPYAAAMYPEVIAAASSVEWVQLPYAGIEPFLEYLDTRLTWTCAKGVYADPVAEWVIAALLMGLRDFHLFAAADSWCAESGRNLFGTRITVLGGGGITRSLMRLLEPWGCRVTVVRR
ncbi:MAG: hydroxyacid dehydrogenase, partial [Acidimicrobiaceae bacterium]|nr:hydroxyacid dehydrogenase [Acidimicrobiaceae bacterium]